MCLLITKLIRRENHLKIDEFRHGLDYEKSKVDHEGLKLKLKSSKLQIEKSNLVIKELVKEKDEEKERLNGVIAGLLAEKEKDKVDKDVMLNRSHKLKLC
ncbi:hypothetical protein HanRHA438_Chr02g0059631 [Helianthus annuus]|nr:hypothetical protein HanHA300_Chr02g0047741 [Helianthus annuus]KAJ0939311.1 hypothetical protein HanRHA438_Chr02g0059631 [Helianthus annuus]